jgi:hypothetical protein
MNELVDLLPIVLVALVLWLGGLTYAFLRLLKHYRKIAEKTKSGDLISAMDNLFQKEEVNSKSVQKILSEIDNINKRGLLSLQKNGFVRFNPFSETGGDQSFSLCLLDGEENGFVITGLHTRDRTRVYTKPIVGGVSKLELSREEEEALKKAKNK